MRALGLDPALGGGSALVCAELGDKLIIIDARSDDGFNKTEQIFEQIEGFATSYNPSLLIVEFDAQQKGIGNDDRLAEMGKRLGYAIRPHITRGQKMDPIFGVASMDQSFRAGDIRIPYGDDFAKDRMQPLVNQLKSWRPDVPTKSLRQDLPMALWFIWKYWMQIKKAQKVPPVPAWRPSWSGAVPEAALRRYA